MSSGKFSLLVMRDSGVVYRRRIRVGLLAGLLTAMLILPLLAGGSTWLAWILWKENTELSTDTAQLEQALREATAKAERLSNLEALLQLQDPTESAAVMQNLAKEADKTPPKEAAEVPTPATQEGPGHSEFPVVDTKVVSVDNTSARLISGRKLRIALDLRNPDPKRTVVGKVRATFITAEGESLPLEILEESGDFRINRFKRAVMQPSLPSGVFSTTNAMVIIEVQEENGTLAYRNIFPVER